MHLSLCSNYYNDATHQATPTGPHGNPRWNSLLPRDWRNQVVAPVEFRTFRDYEMAAEHILGTDEDGPPCFHAYRSVLHELRSDDDEEYYQAAIFGESLTAWRLRDGRWLSHRLSAGESETVRGFFSFGESAPIQLRASRGP